MDTSVDDLRGRHIGGTEEDLSEEFADSLDEDERLAAEALLVDKGPTHSLNESLNPPPRLEQRCRSAPSLLASLTQSLAAEREARREAEAKLKNEIEKERTARLEAESSGKKMALIVSALSPLEKFSLAWLGRTMKAIRCPRPYFCCCGPFFWFFLFLLLIFWILMSSGNEFEESRFLSSAELIKKIDRTNVSSIKILKRPAYRFLDRANHGFRDCLEHKQMQSLLERNTTRVYEQLNRNNLIKKENTLTKEDNRNHPVVIIPGMTSTALEVWQGTGCYADATRQRVWSSRSSTTTFLLDPECLQKHLMLDPKSWDDPQDIRVRAASGLSSADAFGPLNLWGEFIVNLAMLGYDETSVALAAYDWRLDPTRLERRDAYFTRLQRTIETLLETNCGRKVAIISHSLGGNHAFYFFHWVEARRSGWVEKYVDSLSFVGGALLGAPKCLPYIVSGEMTDAFQIGEFFLRLSEMHGGLSRDAIFNLTRTWSSVPSLLPKGGNTFWSLPPAPISKIKDQIDKENLTIQSINQTVPLLELAHPRNQSITAQSLSADAATEFLYEISPEYMRLVDQEYDLRAQNNNTNTTLDPRAWSNPLLTPLPYAPSLKIYCLYGVGRPTPRIIRFVPNTAATKNASTPLNETPIPTEIDQQQTTLKEFLLEHAVHLGTDERQFEISRISDEDGDGTVPLLSLGYMCVEGWKSQKLNPARVRVITKEYLHQEISSREVVTRPLEFMQGLANEKDGDHITILGNREMIGDLIDVTLGGEIELQHSSIVSSICPMSSQIDFVHDAINDSAIDACSSELSKKPDSITTDELTIKSPVTLPAVTSSFPSLSSSSPSSSLDVEL
mmetsp:Transcript_17918/g.26920  ORF Transcript_17918/g.26920 Transcript_17918/m.26920 type:complete len:844 (+) Transcript_17918:134-2665(+)